MKILVVDDDQTSVRLLENLLHRHGYARVKSITDSRFALEACASFDPDLLLLDLVMPEVDGFAILEALRADVNERFFPIVVLTGDIHEEARQHALDAGATDFLVKPLSQAEALLRIRNLLETRRLNVLLRNQRSALEEAVRQRTAELREKIAELEAANQCLKGTPAIGLLKPADRFQSESVSGFTAEHP
jgi:PleD family two-component response regulator